MHGLLWGSVAFGTSRLFSFVVVRMTMYLLLVGAICVELYMLDGIGGIGSPRGVQPEYARADRGQRKPELPGTAALRGSWGPERKRSLPDHDASSGTWRTRCAATPTVRRHSP